ncbi:MAG: DRTGG domain-containing protein [Thermodesulfovibrionales bacterium]|nr:DRTGG domain-containing protein [Thermodesulfovibrionales bacterium]
MITVQTVVNELKSEVFVRGNMDRIITGCYISDMLSDVMAKSKEGELWITLQTHPNIVAVAVIKGLSAIILTNGRQPEAETVKKAEKENLTIIIYNGSTFEAAGKIYMLLNKNT